MTDASRPDLPAAPSPHWGPDFWLANENCFSFLSRIEDGEIDMVMVDPPHGKFRGGGTQIEWDVLIPFEPMWRELRRVVKPTGAMVFVATQPYTTTLIASNLEEFKYTWIWNKLQPSNPLNAKKRPLSIHEDVIVFYRKFGTYRPQGLVEKASPDSRVCHRPSGTVLWHESSKPYAFGNLTNYPLSILVVSVKKKDKGLHPTQKPIKLMQYLVETYTKPGEKVLDFAMGSGTTGVACARAGRRFLGCDSDKVEGYYEICEWKIKEAYEQGERPLDFPSVRPIVHQEEPEPSSSLEEGGERRKRDKAVDARVTGSPRDLRAVTRVSPLSMRYLFGP